MGRGVAEFVRAPHKQTTEVARVSNVQEKEGRSWGGARWPRFTDLSGSRSG